MFFHDVLLGVEPAYNASDVCEILEDYGELSGILHCCAICIIIFSKILPNYFQFLG